jgi:hypothetical protein
MAKPKQHANGRKWIPKDLIHSIFTNTNRSMFICIPEKNEILEFTILFADGGDTIGTPEVTRAVF